MKKIFSFLFSFRLTVVLMLIFALSIGIATFVEDKYDTNTAQLIIYKAWWFELIIFLLVINFIGNLKFYKSFSIGKIGGLIFHLGFIILIIGAGITRYFAYEGNMHIREKGSKNYFLSRDPYLQVDISGPEGTIHKDQQIFLSSFLDNDFTCEVKSPAHKLATIRYRKYYKHATEFINQPVAGGADMLAMKISFDGSGQGVYLKKGERFNAGGVFIAFGDTVNQNNVLIVEEDGKLIIKADKPVAGMFMGGGRPDTTQKGTVIEMREKNLFQYGNVMFAMVQHHQQAELDFKENDKEDGIAVLTLDVEANGQHQKVNLTDLTGQTDQAQKIKMGDLSIDVKYGPKRMMLPFSVKLNKFVLERYPGSMSPMSYASEVSVEDAETNTNFNKRIYMNHVLDYRGFRFFQSSYDPDEKGTILSVNHDFWGTLISYISYVILLLGFVITLLGKNSRFNFLTHAIVAARQKRKALAIIGILLFSVIAGDAQTLPKYEIKSSQADKMGGILVQTMDGRIEPLHTLAFDVMHKIAKKDEFEFEDKGSMDAMQVVIDVIINPEYWKQRKIIYVNDKSVADLVGIEGKYATFNDFVQNGNEYKLMDYVEKAFRKSPSEQNRFDKELIKVDERVNLYYMLLQGSLLKLFPANSESDKWVDWNDSLARQPITGSLGLLNNELGLPEFNYSNLLNAYFQELVAGSRSGNYSKSDKILGYISNIQQNSKNARYFPTASKIKAEIAYNKSGMFKKLVIYYGIISLFLIIFAFADNVQSKSKRWLVIMKQIGIAILMILFAAHTYSMIMRWYLSGHAPWSNGYEALLLIAWSSVFAGFFFLRNTTIIQAATAFLACLVLMTAGHSNYDPQLSNLQPVLQSYWLVIHVAVITASYGFLALGFILGFINMLLYLMKTNKNQIRTDLLITELTLINEMNLQVGLFLATLGTFLGGVWASESWGRYWGWDAKETWALVIVIVYSVVLHMRLVPKLRGNFIFNVSSIVGFSSVLMTFIGVNYYLSKGLHSYAADDKSVFPLWGWMVILAFVLLMTAAGLKERYMKRKES